MKLSDQKEQYSELVQEAMDNIEVSDKIRPVLRAMLKLGFSWLLENYEVKRKD